MIKTPLTLPKGALLGTEADRLAPVLEAEDALWFAAGPEWVAQTGAQVDHWTSRTGRATAKPNRPNDGNGRLLEGPIPTMAFRAGLPCGFSAAAIAPNTDRFSVALLYRSENRDGRTLFSVQAAEGGNILFANEHDGQLTVKDRENAVDIKTPAPARADGFNLLIAAYQPGVLRVKINDEPTLEARGEIGAFSGAAELFIGCRNHRGGLGKTLGAHETSDVFFWPDQMLLAPSDTAEAASLNALRSYWRWNR